MVDAVCPKCGSSNYSREDIEPEDTTIFVDCECLDCGALFTETFELVSIDKKEYENE